MPRRFSTASIDQSTGNACLRLWPHPLRTSNYSSSICLSNWVHRQWIERKGGRCRVCETCHSFCKRSVGSAQVFVGRELATPQAFSASERRCLPEPLPQEGWVPKPGRSRQSWWSRTVRSGEPTGVGFAGLQHPSRPNGWLSASGRRGGGRGLQTLGMGGGQFSAGSRTQLAGVGLGRSHRKSVEKGSVSPG